ncbi:glucosaminidase domain-containing protein [Patescibacteria group bacterium]|nr:glucosaminidase domain-containing protein [Patescibacteria group bacterium]
MNKLIYILFLILVIGSPITTNAAEKASASSAKITYAVVSDREDYRVKILENYLNKWSSPLAPHAESFISNADKYNLDWRLVAAISGVESGFGKHIPYNSYNGWGWGIYGNNSHGFPSWENGIETISQGLREKYMDRWGAKDVYGIGNFYAADPNWANKVTNFMNKIGDYAYSNPSDVLSISI